MSLTLCPQVVSEGPQHFKSLRRKPLVIVAFPASLSTWSFPLTPAWTGQFSMGVIRNGCQTLTHSSLGFPFHFTHFIASSLNLWGWWYVWSDLLRQSSRDHMWQLPLPLSSRRLRSCKAAQFSWIVVAPCLTVKAFPDWSLMTELSLCVIISRSLLFSWMWSLISESLLPTNSAFPSFSVSHRSARVGLDTFAIPWFALALIASVPAV